MLRDTRGMGRKGCCYVSLTVVPESIVRRAIFRGVGLWSYRQPKSRSSKLVAQRRLRPLWTKRPHRHQSY